MASWDDVRQIAASLPETTEQTSFGNTAWGVKKKTFVWARPLRKGDLAALGAAAPTGPILGARVEHEGLKEVLITSNPAVFFTIPHFNGYPAILLLLENISVEELREVMVDAWLVQAPKKLAKEYLASAHT